MISANQPVPVNNCIQYENTNQWADDIQNDIRPQTVNVDVPEIHSETQDIIQLQGVPLSLYVSSLSHLIAVPFMT